MSAQRILIVDDEAEIRRIMQMHLHRKGFEVDIAGGTQEAAQMLGSDKQYDLVVCDFRMPDGNGLEVFKKLKGSTRFILISGFSDMDETQLRGMGIQEIIAKPVNMTDLIQRIRATLIA